MEEHVISVRSKRKTINFLYLGLLSLFFILTIIMAISLISLIIIDRLSLDKLTEGIVLGILGIILLICLVTILFMLIIAIILILKIPNMPEGIFNKKKIITKGKFKPFEERFYSLSSLLYFPGGIFISLIFISFIIQLSDVILSDYINICFIIPVIYMVVHIYLHLYLFSVQVKCNREELFFVDRPRFIYKILYKKHTFKPGEIRSIRPITASIFNGLFPGFNFENGRINLIRTGVRIVDNENNQYNIITSRPMDVIRLLGK